MNELMFYLTLADFRKSELDISGFVDGVLVQHEFGLLGTDDVIDMLLPLLRTTYAFILN